VISLTSKGPGSSFAAYATVGGSPEYGKEYFEGAVGGPINDTLGVRLAVRVDHENGFLQNFAQPGLVNPFYCNPGPGPCVHPLTEGNAQGSTVPDYTSIFGRLTVVWRPSADFQATFKLVGGVYNDNGDVANTQNVCTTGHPMYNYIGVPVTMTDADCTLDLHTSIGSWPAAMAAHWQGQHEGGRPFSNFSPIVSSLNMSYNFGKLTLTSVTGIIVFSEVNEGNSDNNVYTVAGGGNNEYGQQYSEELRVASHFDGPLNFLAGIYLEHTFRKYVVNSHFLPDFLKVDCGFGQGYDCRNGRSGDYEADDPTTDDTVSPFAQVTWHITPQLTADAGARYVYERVSARVGNVYVNQSIFPFVAAGLFSPEGAIVGGKISDGNWSPEATLTYKPARDWTIYAAYKTGYQSGGFSNPGLLSPGLTAAALSFKPMTASGEELGIKWETMQHTLRGDFTLYDYTFKNDQIQSAQLLFPEGPNGPQTVFYSIRNAAAAVTKGAELEVTWDTPVTGLSLNAFANYNVGKFQSYPDAPCPTGTAPGIAPCIVITPASGTTPEVDGVNLTGHPLANAPLWTLRFGFDYHHELTQNVSWGVSFDANYRSSQYLAQPASPYANIPYACEFGNKVCGLWLYDASARVYTNDGKWELAVIGKNLADTIYPITTGSVLFGATPSQLAAGIGLPLELLFQLTYHY
jgi:outer membrane receptor protein involved in Fe transport